MIYTYGTKSTLWYSYNFMFVNSPKTIDYQKKKKIVLDDFVVNQKYFESFPHVKILRCIFLINMGLIVYIATPRISLFPVSRVQPSAFS